MGLDSGTIRPRRRDTAAPQDALPESSAERSTRLLIRLPHLAATTPVNQMPIAARATSTPVRLGPARRQAREHSPGVTTDYDTHSRGRFDRNRTAAAHQISDASGNSATQRDSAGSGTRHSFAD